MEIGEWVLEEKSRLGRFHDWWKRNHAENPEMFPLTMPEGEWDEQYRLFLDEESEDTRED